ncbi:MAG: NAD(P)H-dependent oxidoreductase [Proteobacteria bacterium]|nr:NAD(P)H-dependent oxidoreductase [Pseudomonadota bacterium]
MKIGIIVGSHKKVSNSAKVAKYATEACKRLIPNSSTWTLDLANHPLPLWDEGVWQGTKEWKDLWGPISRDLTASDAYIVVSPEYGGMVPAALKNFFLLVDKTEVGHKPGLIVAVSSGRGGSYPVVELRSSSYKNCRLNWIPDHMIVRDADHVLNSPNFENESDKLTRDRLDYCIKLLGEYSKALRSVRASGAVDFKNHPNGL